MAKRFTDTDKYKDNWFIDISPNAKLLFYYLIDNVDSAGFWEESVRSIQFFLGLNPDEYNEAKKGLAKAIIISDDGNTLYLKNFLRHQKNIPLNKYNNAHKSIIQLLQSEICKFKNNEYFFNNIPCRHIFKSNGEVLEIKEEILGATLAPNQPLIRGTGKGNGKGNSNILKEGKHLFKNSKYFDLKLLEDGIGVKYRRFDVAYYHESARIYSESKGAMYKDWKSTIQGFMRRDESEGKAKYKKTNTTKAI